MNIHLGFAFFALIRLIGAKSLTMRFLLALLLLIFKFGVRFYEKYPDPKTGMTIRLILARGRRGFRRRIVAASGIVRVGFCIMEEWSSALRLFGCQSCRLQQRKPPRMFLESADGMRIGRTWLWGTIMWSMEVCRMGRCLSLRSGIVGLPATSDRPNLIIGSVSSITITHLLWMTLQTTGRPFAA